MNRDGLEKLREWRKSKNRLPLILKGARQVGKTWLVEEFGRLDFSNTVKINFEKNPSIAKAFDGDIDPKRILHLIEIFTDQKILPENTLIFLDEIQECPRALTSLKYFAEEAPEYVVVAAGSLLGIAGHQGLSFPVGKVNFMNLYPMSFSEYLTAAGDGKLAKLLSIGDFSSIDVFRVQYEERLREYMVVGGMPDAVKLWIETGSSVSVRRRQEEIIESYISDFSKHAPASIAVKCRQIIISIASQLAKENKKFIFSHVREGARAKEYEECFAWLSSCGIINMVKRVTVPNIPINAYEEQNVFKLFFHDVGLLSALSGLDFKVVLDGNEVYDLFKGALTEQYVLQQLLASGWKEVHYYSNDRSTAEIDFLLDFPSAIIPLEVKSGVNTKAKSLRTYNEKYKPNISLRTSLLPYKEQDWLINIPLYAVSSIRELCGRFQRF